MRGHLLDVESIGIVLKGDPRHIQAIPIDEVVVQCIVDGVKIRDADIACELQCRFLCAIAHLGVAAQAPADQGHRRVLGDVRLNRLEIDAVQFQRQIGGQRLRRDIAAHVERTGTVDAGIEGGDRHRLGEIQAHALHLRR